MRNRKSACIFDHHGFVYTLNFDTMTCWIMNEEDEENPVTSLDVKRTDKGTWLYRAPGVDASVPFQLLGDPELEREFEKQYEQYVNLIVVENGRVPRSKAASKPPQRLR